MTAATQALALKVVTTTPSLAWGIQEIVGDKAEVESLLTGHEDPHYVDAVPKFIFKASKADIVCFIGRDLEVGWLPAVLKKSGNAKVQTGGSGYCDTGSGITVLEKPEGEVDRSQGHVHPSGNPHFWVSPKTFFKGLEVAFNVLVSTDTENAATYAKNFVKLRKSFENLEKESQKALQKIKGKGPVMQYHSSFTYLIHDYGIESLGELEEKPGVKPSMGHLFLVAQKAKKAGVKVVLATERDPESILKKFTEISGIPYIRVPDSLKVSGKSIESYVTVHKKVVETIVNAY